MTHFTKTEQAVTDFEWFAVDKNECIGVFTTGGDIDLPLNIAAEKETYEKILTYFENLEKKHHYEFSPELETHLSQIRIASFDRFVSFYGGMSSRGLYSFSNYPPNLKTGSYFLVTTPTHQLKFGDLPGEIRTNLEKQRLFASDFETDYVVYEEIIEFCMSYYLT